MLPKFDNNTKDEILTYKARSDPDTIYFDQVMKEPYTRICI